MSAATTVQADPAVRLRFEPLAAEWKAKALYLSNTAQMAVLRPYQRIIGMGPLAVPLILEELAREPMQWFWALEAITGVDPVRTEDKGDVLASADAWLRWGRSEGLLGP